MDPLNTLSADVKSALASASPLNAGALIKAGIKVSMETKALIGISHKEKIELLRKVMVVEVTALKVKEEAKAKEEDRPAIAERYAQLILVADSVLPSALESVIEIVTGKFDVKALLATTKPATWFSWFSCLTASAVSAAAVTGLVSEAQAKPVETEKKVEVVAAVEVNVDSGAGVFPDVSSAVAATAVSAEAVAVEAVVVESASAPESAVVDLSGASQPIPTEPVPAENTQ
jgi:hypothetical protein